MRAARPALEPRALGLACSARGGPTLATLAPSHPSLCRVRRLGRNKLGPEGGMALAEALKSNSTLERLESAALPSNLPPNPAIEPAQPYFVYSLVYSLHTAAHPESLPLPPTSPQAALTPRGPRPRPLLPHGRVARRPCTLTLARRRLLDNDLGAAAERALRAAARSGFRLILS